MSSPPEPQPSHERSSAWREALRDDGDRQQWRSFWRRSRHAHPVLYWLMVGAVVTGGALRWLGREHGSSAWALWFWLGSLAVALTCLVLLIRRDDPPAAS